MKLVWQPVGPVSDVEFPWLELRPGQTADIQANGEEIRGITKVRSSAGHLTLERPARRDGFERWITRARFGRVGSDAVRTNALLVIYNGDMTPVNRYTLRQAWPSRCGSPPGPAGHVAIERLAIQAEGFEQD